MSNIKSFSEYAEELGFQEVWVAFDSENLGLLTVHDSVGSIEICGVEVFTAPENVGGPVAEALASRGISPSQFTPTAFEELVEQADPDAEAIHFFAITSEEGCLMLPRTFEGAEYIHAVRIQDEYQDLAEEEGLSGLGTLNQTASDC